MREDDALKYSYALAKQLDSAYALETNYGTLELDDEMQAAVAAVLRPILTTRLHAIEGVNHG
ncbi:hypothetical protein V8Z80_04830 [Orrella sp. JC864]|uniref:hypothetical protein n=1 Tax=Orrella sp. JC864 TaxID=3120298 RepID=UPI0030081D0C